MWLIQGLNAVRVCREENVLMALVELERAIDRVFPELVWWALRCLNVMYV